MYKFIILLLLQCYNFSLFAELWSPKLLGEFRALAENISKHPATSSNQFKISEDLRTALFKSKGPGRLETRKFIELNINGEMKLVCCKHDDNTLTFTKEPFQKFRNFLQACRKNGEYVQPTLEMNLPPKKIVKTTEENSSVHQESAFSAATKEELPLSSSPNITEEPLFPSPLAEPINTRARPKTIRPLQFTLNSASHIIGGDTLCHPNADASLRVPNPTTIARGCQINKITFRESTKRDRCGKLTRYYIADSEKCSLLDTNLQQIVCAKNKIYFLSYQYIKLLDHNYNAKTVCSPLVPPKHFLPMDDGSFITTSMHDGQWILHHHKPSGIVVSLPVANLEIIALTTASSNSAAFLTDRGIFLYKTNAQEPALEYYYYLDEKYNDITCKNTDGSWHFFITHTNKQMIREIYQEPTMKPEYRDFHPERNVGALEYDAKNDRLLIADTEFGQIGIFSCELKLIHECPPVLGLISFSISDDGALFCLSESIP